MRPSDFDLGPFETIGFGLQSLRYQFFGRQMQPPAFGGVQRHPALRAAEQLPQRQLLAFGAPVPECCIDACERQAGHGTDGSGMRMKK